jgi:hypothetical protein
MRRTVIVVAWLLSLAAVAVVAQQPRVVVPDGKPTVIAGNDIGFRVDGYRRKTRQSARLWCVSTASGWNRKSTHSTALHL